MEKKARSYIGFLILLVGVLRLLVAVTGLHNGWLESAFFVLIGAFLYFFYTRSSQMGFLIAACITGFAGLSILGADLPFFKARDAASIGLVVGLQGAAFASMYLLGLRRRWVLVVAWWGMLAAVFFIFESSFWGLLWGGALNDSAFFGLMGLGFFGMRLLGVGRLWPLLAGLGGILMACATLTLDGLIDDGWLGVPLSILLIIVGLALFSTRRRQA